MTRKKVLGMCQVTCGRSDVPSPYLKEQWQKVIKGWVCKGMKALDLGCGSGRNTKFLRSKGLVVEDIDVCHKDVKQRYDLGENVIPVPASSVNLILLNYVLMFLSEAELSHLAEEIRRVAKYNCLIVIEMYPAKDSHCKTNDDCDIWRTMFKQYLLPYQDWRTIHKVKNRQIWQRMTEIDV